MAQDFIIDKMLGDGAFSEVYRAKRRSDSEEVAIKIIKKEKVAVHDLIREVDIWQLASKSCSRVVQLYEIYEDEDHVYLVMELMVGGELFEKIANMTDYSEAYASKIMKQVFLIIRDLHKVDIIHQDLKPENLLLMGDSMILKLCDFGLAEIADDNTELFGCVGSTTYMAPEVTNETGHHKPVDIYAAGVIMYIMLCGYPPFEPENGIVELEFPDREWDDITVDAKELITLLLDEDPLKRPSPEEVLRHRWFMNVETIRNPKNLMKTVNTLRQFQQLGPNGTMKEYRGDTAKGNRNSVIGLFEEPASAPPASNGDKKGDAIKKSSANVPLPGLKIPAASPESPKKKGARTDRPAEKDHKDKEHKKANTNIELPKDIVLPTKEELKAADKKKDKKKNDKKKRASASMATDLKDINFDPKAFTKKSEPEPQMSESDKKKKEKKKTDKKKGKDGDTKSSLEYIPIGGNYQPLDELLAAFHKELHYQNSLLEQLKQENSLLKAKMAEESESRQAVLEKLLSEISLLRKEAEEEQRERRLLQTILEHNAAALASVGAGAGSAAKAGSPAPNAGKDTKTPQQALSSKKKKPTKK
uniref:Protein kinase domain-containing protein n=1 Tax=Arcella intermedia TaxID=1963864 RepID=A0A6B2L0E6_9EUKA